MSWCGSALSGLRLKRSLSHRVVTFTKAERPAATPLDMNLPDANGTQTLDQLRLLRPDVPIVMVTANADLVLAREALHRGAFDYVMKPFDMERLGQVLEAAVDSWPR